MQDTFSLDFGQSIQAQNNVWYRNIQVLGQGGNAITFLALATSGPEKGVLFAIKVFRKLSSQTRKTAFLKEIEFLEKTTHPSIMRVYNAGVFTRYSNEYPFVAAEYLPKTLADIIKTDSASIPERISYALQMLSALSYLANSDPSVIHRDIKPQNIFVKGGSCVLGDFGLMKLANQDDDSDREVLKESELPGMPFYYRTPDLIRYARRECSITPKSDVFQLGLVLAELFSGRNPAKRPQNILADMELENIAHIRGQLGGGIVSLLKRMLVMNPESRESASQLMDAWQGIFENALEQAHTLEGRVFS